MKVKNEEIKSLAERIEKQFPGIGFTLTFSNGLTFKHFSNLKREEEIKAFTALLLQWKKEAESAN